MKRLPEKYTIPNLYNIPIHNQRNKNNCTSHEIAASIEYQLSTKLKERTLVDVDDLWKKQKKFGTATEERGDTIPSALAITQKYGVKFKTDSGKTGTLFIGRGIVWDKN